MEQCKRHYFDTYIFPESFPLPTPAPELANLTEDQLREGTIQARSVRGAGGAPGPLKRPREGTEGGAPDLSGFIMSEGGGGAKPSTSSAGGMKLEGLGADSSVDVGTTGDVEPTATKKEETEVERKDAGEGAGVSGAEGEMAGTASKRARHEPAAQAGFSV